MFAGFFGMSPSGLLSKGYSYNEIPMLVEYSCGAWESCIDKVTEYMISAQKANTNLQVYFEGGLAFGQRASITREETAKATTGK